MTVKELYDELGNYIKMGHANTRVIANCDFTICRKGSEYEHNIDCKPEHYDDFYLPTYR